MVKMTPSEGQFLTKNFDLRGQISTFWAENTPKNAFFKAKDNAQTTSEQLQKNFQKPQKTDFLALKMAKITLSEGFDFRGHISTFRAESTPKSTSFKAKNNAQTTSEHLQNNFQKPQKTGFLAPKMVKMTPSEGQFLTKNFDFRGQISTFRAENTRKSVSFNVQNNAQNSF